MKIVRCKWFPPKNFKAITLAKWIIVRGDARISEYGINHEEIHYAQMKPMLFVFFYLWYVLEFLLVRLIQYRSWMKAYRNISFEREAYANMYDLEYPSKRKLFAWTKYLFHE